MRSQSIHLSADSWYPFLLPLFRQDSPVTVQGKCIVKKRLVFGSDYDFSGWDLAV